MAQNKPFEGLDPMAAKSIGRTRQKRRSAPTAAGSDGEFSTQNPLLAQRGRATSAPADTPVGRSLGSRRAGAPSKPVTLIQFFPAIEEQTLLREMNLPYVVVNLAYPTGGRPSRPTLIDDEVVVRGRGEIIAHLEAKHADLDSFLDEDRRLEASAIRSLVHGKLDPLLVQMQVQSEDFAYRVAPLVRDHIGLRSLPQIAYLKSVLQGDQRRRALDGGVSGVPLYAARDRILRLYADLERKLPESVPGSYESQVGSGFLFSADLMCTADVALFSHLVRALAVRAVRDALPEQTFPRLHALVRRVSREHFSPAVATSIVQWRSTADFANSANAFWPVLPGVEYARRTSFYLDNFLFVEEDARPAEKAEEAGGAEDQAKREAEARQARDNEAWWNFTALVTFMFATAIALQVK